MREQGTDAGGVKTPEDKPLSLEKGELDSGTEELTDQLSITRKMQHAISQYVKHAYLIVIDLNIVYMELYYKSTILLEILAKPFAKRNKRKQGLIEQISENTIHQIVIVYDKSRHVPANFLKRSLL